MNDKWIYSARRLPASLNAEDVADYLGLPPYSIHWLVKAGHLRPLGKPTQNSVKRFATADLERHARDRAWMDKAVRIIERAVQDNNRKAQTSTRKLAA